MKNVGENLYIAFYTIVFFGVLYFGIDTAMNNSVPQVHSNHVFDSTGFGHGTTQSDVAIYVGTILCLSLIHISEPTRPY